MLSGRSRRMSAIVAGAANSPLTVSNASNSQQKLSERELKQLFDECLKVAAENKINANNSWSLGLIEYFHDLTYLKDGDSINFQKASCTLDGCVKIYTSRIDFVDSETKKLMSGLADKDDEALLEDYGEDDGTQGTCSAKQSRRKAPVPGNTLESNVDKLNSQKFDLEFRVDPLFKKTCADFDEGGAKGLLLNHLNLGLDGKIVFDATDDQDQVEEVIHDSGTLLDISIIQEKFGEFLEKMEQQEVCPSLMSFRFNESNNIFDPQKYLENAQEMLQQIPTLQEELDRQHYDDDDDDHHFGTNMGDAGGWNDGGGTDYNNFDGYDYNSMAPDQNPIPMIIKQMNEIRRKSTRLSLTPGELGDENQAAEWAQDDDQHYAMFSYFDKALIKNWMGPEMWRARAIKDNQSPDSIDNNEQKQQQGQENKKKRSRASEIDFDTPVDDSVLFARSNANIDLTKSQQVSKDPHLLPEDLQFTSKDFLSLFLKPKQAIKFRKRVVVNEPSTVDEPMEESQQVERIETEFWAQNEVEHDIPVAQGYDHGIDYYGQDDMAPAFDSEDDEPVPVPVFSVLGFDNTQGSNGLFSQYSSSDWRSQLVSEPKKVKTQFVNYARVAKKVDVKRLKENLWSSLQHKQEDKFEQSSQMQNTTNDDVVANHDNSNDFDITMDKTSATDTSSSKAILRKFPILDNEEKTVPFTEVVHDLRPQYSDKKWKDISVAFCFICLLHLANENDLEILPTASIDPQAITRATVYENEDEEQNVLSRGVNTELLIKGNN